MSSIETVVNERARGPIAGGVALYVVGMVGTAALLASLEQAGLHDASMQATTLAHQSGLAANDILSAPVNTLLLGARLANDALQSQPWLPAVQSALQQLGNPNYLHAFFNGDISLWNNIRFGSPFAQTALAQSADGVVHFEGALQMPSLDFVKMVSGLALHGIALRTIIRHAKDRTLKELAAEWDMMQGGPVLDDGDGREGVDPQQLVEQVEKQRKQIKKLEKKEKKRKRKERKKKEEKERKRLLPYHPLDF